MLRDEITKILQNYENLLQKCPENFIETQLLQHLLWHFAHDKWFFCMGITKACTHLHPAPSTSIQLISTSTQLHPPPTSLFQPPPSSLQHPQQYLNQNIARNWAISPNLGQKLKVVNFD